MGGDNFVTVSVKVDKRSDSAEIAFISRQFDRSFGELAVRKGKFLT